MRSEKKIISIFDAGAICYRRKRKGKKVVLTSGCFDLLHGGHLEYLMEAGDMGFLVVGINSDISVKKLKGDARPIRGERDRAFVMTGFIPVKLVIIFEDDCELIDSVYPDIYVASTTSVMRVWDDEKRMRLLNRLGSKIVEIDSEKNDSTTDMVKRANIISVTR